MGESTSTGEPITGSPWSQRILQEAKGERRMGEQSGQAQGGQADMDHAAHRDGQGGDNAGLASLGEAAGHHIGHIGAGGEIESQGGGQKS